MHGAAILEWPGLKPKKYLPEHNHLLLCWKHHAHNKTPVLIRAKMVGCGEEYKIVSSRGEAGDRRAVVCLWENATLRQQQKQARGESGKIDKLF